MYWITLNNACLTGVCCVVVCYFLFFTIQSNTAPHYTFNKCQRLVNICFVKLKSEVRFIEKKGQYTETHLDDCLKTKAAGILFLPFWAKP